MTQGRLAAIWIKRAHRGPMDAMSAAMLVEGQGIAGNVDRSRRRQVSILERESWDACMRELGGNVNPSARRANLLIEGVRLLNTRGRVLRIGDVRLAIGGELTPCERMDEALPGLQRSMKRDWRGGVFAQVVQGGVIRVDDVVQWEVEQGES